MDLMSNLPSTAELKGAVAMFHPRKLSVLVLKVGTKEYELPLDLSRQVWSAGITAPPEQCNGRTVVPYQEGFRLSDAALAVLEAAR